MEDDKIFITREQFYDLLWSTPITTLAKKYIINDASIRAICKNLNIPTPKAGHWEKLRHNKEVEIIPLPNHEGEELIELMLRTDDVQRPMTELSILEQSMKDSFPKGLRVKDKLKTPDKLVVDAKLVLERNKSRWSRNGLLETHGEPLPIKVSQSQLNRALIMLDTLIKAIKERSHSLVTRNGRVYIIVEDQEVVLSIREKTKRTLRTTHSSWNEYDFFPTGKLVLTLRFGYEDFQWIDGKKRVENQLTRVLIKLESRSKQLKLERAKMEAQWKVQRERQEQEKLIKERKIEDHENFLKLLGHSERWNKAENLRRYLNAMEAAMEMIPEKQSWMSWARKKADWLDPLIGAIDELQGSYG